MKPAEKLARTRQHMQQQGIEGFVQPVHDEYMNEYPPACAQRVRWLSGFSGSAGALVVLADKAALFTDGRYTLQAAEELDAELFEQHNMATQNMSEWLARQAAGKTIGYDPRLFTRAMLTAYEKHTKDADIKWVAADNVVDAAWDDQPAAPATDLFVHALQYSGMAAEEKRAQLTAIMQDKKADSWLLTAPDSICWLLNIRASDVEHAPLLLANLLLAPDGTAKLFVDPARCDEATQKHLGDAVSLHHPDMLQSALTEHGRRNHTVLADTRSVSLWHMQALEGANVVDTPDACQCLKAIKNPTELAGMRAAHVRDGAAIVKLLHWLDTQGAPVTELDICNKLHDFRASDTLFHDESFPTISGSGPNGAIVHYRASERSNRPLQEGELLLLDSGGQYPDGTTDITRTVPIGPPSGEMCDRFTRVLKGHIAIATARFPKGTSGSQLDTLARQPMWEAGLDYDHGTGHGVGCFLSVHEGPQRISKRGNDVALEPGMILSNEPGYYKTGAYGIRIENLVAVVESGDGEGGAFYGFDTVTCAPIDTRLVLPAMLTEAEKHWLNSYHDWVKDTLSSYLNEAEQVWLAQRCAGIE